MMLFINNRPKATTLIELLVALILLSVVVLGAFSFSLAANQFLGASERKVEVLNELTYVLDYLHKTIDVSSGYLYRTPSDRAVVYSGNTLTIKVPDTTLDFTDDPPPISCTFDGAAHTIVCDGETLSERYLAPASGVSFTAPDAAGRVAINNITIRYNPNIPAHAITNPEAVISNVIFNPSSQSGPNP